MPYIIDGYNFIFSDDELRLLLREKGSAAARDALVAAVSAFNSHSRRKAKIIFDGSPSAGVLPRRQKVKGVEVVFSTHPEDADSAIIDALKASPARRALTVVTDDGKIRRAAKKMKAGAAGCDEFAAELDSVFERMRRRERNALPREKLAGVPKGDVGRWLAAFGFKE